MKLYMIRHRYIDRYADYPHDTVDEVADDGNVDYVIFADEEQAKIYVARKNAAIEAEVLEKWQIECRKKRAITEQQRQYAHAMFYVGRRDTPILREGPTPTKPKPTESYYIEEIETFDDKRV